MSGKVAWSVREWSDATSICKALVWKLVADGRIKSVKFGARRLITTPPADYVASLAA